jgi:hypothetical protein
MKKTITLFVVFAFITGHAQDTIFKTDGSKHIGKVAEINGTSVKYLLSGTDVMVETAKNEIRQINYLNGTKEMYNTAAVAQTTPKYQTESYYTNEKYKAKAPEKTKEYGKNIFALNMFEMFFTNLGVSYERILGDGTFSVKIPFSTGLGGRPNENSYRGDMYSVLALQNKIYSTGLEFNVYPAKQTRSTFYIGLSGGYGEFKYYRDSLISAPYPGPYVYTHKSYLGKQYYGMIHLGGYIGLTEQLLLGGKAAIGFRREETILVDYTMPRIQLDFNLAYRF